MKPVEASEQATNAGNPYSSEMWRRRRSLKKMTLGYQSQKYHPPKQWKARMKFSILPKKRLTKKRKLKYLKPVLPGLSVDSSTQPDTRENVAKQRVDYYNEGHNNRAVII